MIQFVGPSLRSLLSSSFLSLSVSLPPNEFILLHLNGSMTQTVKDGSMVLIVLNSFTVQSIVLASVIGCQTIKHSCRLKDTNMFLTSAQTVHAQE